MFYDPDVGDHGLAYNPIKALTVPRPIGWISTISKDGVGNLAPYSYFNGLSYNPAFVMFSGGCRTDGSKKDTVVNAEKTGEFVFNMATWDTRSQMNDTSWILDPDVNELAAAGLTAVPSTKVAPPRVAESPVQLECRYHETIVLPGNKPQEVHHVVFGRVVGVHIDDEFITSEGLVDTLKMKVIARLGYKDYTVIESSFSIDNVTIDSMATGWDAAKKTL